MSVGQGPRTTLAMIIGHASQTQATAKNKELDVYIDKS
jgi:hypothetical protein